MKDVCPAIVSDSMLMGALKAALPCAYDGEGYIRQALSGGRYPYPTALVDEVVESITAAILKITNPDAFQSGLTQSLALSSAPGLDKDISVVGMHKIGNGEDEARQCRVDADLGDADAQFKLAEMYASDQVLERDTSEAIRWYRLAANQGHAEAQFKIGTMYENGRGVTKDFTEAIRWYRLAAEQGHIAAQCNLGLAYSRGRGTARNTSEAARWYRLAAEQGHRGAQLCLAEMYRYGRGVVRDVAEAEHWYALATNQMDE